MSRYYRASTPNADLEHNEQAALVTWFKRDAHTDLAPLLVNIPNGARRTRWEAIRAKQEGLTAGAPDLFLFVARGSWHGLAIEMKWQTEEWRKGKAHTERSYQSREQREWQAVAEAQGYRYEVVRTADEGRKLITEYLNYNEQVYKDISFQAGSEGVDREV